MGSKLGRRRILSFAFLVTFLFSALFAWGGCSNERRSAGEKPKVAEEKSGDSAKDTFVKTGNEEGENVVPTKPHENVELDEEKARRLATQLSNYTMAICAQEGCPADLEALKPILRSKNSISWPKDPWQTPYIYKKKSDSEFVIFSAGPDQKEGTEDDIYKTPDKKEEN